MCYAPDAAADARAMIMHTGVKAKSFRVVSQTRLPHPCSAVKKVGLTNQSGSGLLFCRPDSTNRPSLSDTVMAC